MDIWEIVIIILVIINVIAFASAIWVSVDKWKQGEKEWKIPMMGLFFIPLCVFLVLAYPYILYKENRAKCLKEEEEAMRMKEWQETKRYHFHQFAFRLKDLPFKPSSEEIIYVENVYDERINQIIKRNLDYIQECFDGNRYVQPHFVYLPNLSTQLSKEEQSIYYVVPSICREDLASIPQLTSSFLLDYMLVPENRSNITPCFARYRGEEDGYSLFECIGFDPEDDIDEKRFVRKLCAAYDYFPKPTGRAYQTKKPNENADADEKFAKESKVLIKEIEERISKLRKMGVSQWALEQLVKPEQKLSRLVITKDYRLLLPEYNNMEIKMEPLVKAVYLLFLNHPEGILFKHLPDYREELTEFYVKLKPYGMSDRVVQSIEDVTNPLLNSINEKCARIRGAFVGQFDDHLARHYYIDGLRGEAKKIALHRDLVVWE
jgi:hypothetical protein